MAMVNKKSYIPKKKEEKKVETPWLETVLDDIKYFKENAHKNEGDKNKES